MADSALGRLRILDFSRVLAGPLATMTLADLGAEVTKVERPGAATTPAPGDRPTTPRARRPTSRRSTATSAASCSTSASRRTWPRRGGWRSRADVVVENFRPGVMAKLGLGYEELAAENPGLVYCSITGFGGSGAGAELPGYDLLVQALGGLMSVTGEPDGEPLKVGVALVDVIAGLYAAVGILAALRAPARERRGAAGRGRPALGAARRRSSTRAPPSPSPASVPGRMGNRHPSIAPYELLRCSEGELVLAVGNDRQFRALCQVLGAPGLADEARFATNPARVEHREELRPLLEAALAARPAAEWVELLRARRVPAGVVNDVGAAFAFAERIGLDPIAEIPREDGAPVRLPRSPIRLSKTPASYRLPPPRLP